MRGSIHLRKDVKQPWWFVKWHHRGVQHHIGYYKGKRMHQMHPDKIRDHGHELARRLISEMRTDVERGEFRIDRYTGDQKTDVIDLYKKWLKTKQRKKPNTVKGYTSYFKRWIKPFFREHNYMLHEIQLDTLYELMDSIKLQPKGKWNVMTAFHTFLNYAWRSNRISELPPFPTRDEYGIVKPIPIWLAKDEQEAIFNNLPEPQVYPFLWLTMHYRRPGEACALHKFDYDSKRDAFIIRRAISARKLVDSTKTSQIHYIPCNPGFTPIARKLINENIESPFLFVNPKAKKAGGRFTLESLRNVWYKACDDAGVERIWPYRGTKHTACTHFVEDGGTIEELQMLTEHRDKRSLEHYAEITLNRKRALMEKADVIRFKKVSG